MLISHLVLAPIIAQISPILSRSFVFLLRHTGSDDHVDAIKHRDEVFLMPEVPIKVSLPSSTLTPLVLLSLFFLLYHQAFLACRTNVGVAVCAFLANWVRLCVCAGDGCMHVSSYLPQIVATLAGGTQKRTFDLQPDATAGMLVQSLTSA